MTIKYKNKYSKNELNTITKQLHQSLKSSRSHYNLMINSKYKKVNIGFYSQIKNGKLTIVVAQHYIR